MKDLKEKPHKMSVGSLAELKETAVDKTGNISESSEDLNLKHLCVSHYFTLSNAKMENGRRQFKTVALDSIC